MSPLTDLKPAGSWRILDLLKIHSSPKQPASPTSEQSNRQKDQKSPQNNVSKCSCCGTVLVFPENTDKFSCPQCHTTNLLHLDINTPPPVHLLSHHYVKNKIDECMKSAPPPSSSHELHQRLKPVLDYLFDAFASMTCLNQSFKIRPQRRVHYSTSNLDLADLRNLFLLLASLPTRRPLYCALSGACNCLKRLPLSLSDDPRNLSWVVILLNIPFLSKAFTNNDKRSHHQRPASMAEVPEIQALCYDILKRVLGIVSQTESTLAGNYLASWLLKLSNVDFMCKVELINLYITFHLRKYFYFANNPNLARRSSLGSADHLRPQGNISRRESISHPPDDEYFHYSYLKDEVEGVEGLPSSPPHSLLLSALLAHRQKSLKKKKNDMKVRVHQYSQNYHLRTAAGALSIFVKANYIRHGPAKIPMHAFYNSLVDYVNIKLDFDSWLSKRKLSHQSAGAEPALQTVIDYIHGSNLIPFADTSPSSTFYFCQYPFLITLGGKIAILEYEARRQMERKAEEAFINSLDKRVAYDVYFKVKVRRECIVQDSLRCIHLNPNNLKKSLRVQFINEPGVDAGGLKKEWFLLLTRALFSPTAGMLSYVEDSNLLWFNVLPVDNFEMYYLFGAILGLAIYNSTILDLRFPLAMYKILLGLPIGLADYQELFPMSAKNLFKLREYSDQELRGLDLNFEVAFQDIFGKVHHRELVPGGRSLVVDADNREIYIDKYARFFLWDGMKEQLCAFKRGFSSVVDGNAFSLFLPDEIQLLLCGSDESRFDVDVLKSITHYGGWPLTEEAETSDIVKWFWEYVADLSYKQQKKLLLFLTGSDRVPATGIQNLTLKISRLDRGNDSDRLPVAHTCFNELAIYQYSSKEKMVEKMNQAVNMSAGFGIK